MQEYAFKKIYDKGIVNEAKFEIENVWESTHLSVLSYRCFRYIHIYCHSAQKCVTGA